MVAKAITETKEKAQDAPRERTVGNKVFDLLVYPSIAFGAVFAFSTWMLHTTKFGKGYWHEQYKGWVDSLTRTMEGSSAFKGQSHKELFKKASNYITAGVSFAVGTALIAPIKIFEDYRGKISHKIDNMLGAKPDPAAYDQEPKQSWSSVLGGRVITFASIVLLVAAVGHRIDRNLESIANKVASTWSKWNPSASASQLTKIKEWSYVSVFEGFYSAATATLIYFASRGLARIFNKKENKPNVRTNHPDSASEAEEPSEIGSVSHAAREAERKQTAAQAMASIAL